MSYRSCKPKRVLYSKKVYKIYCDCIIGWGNKTSPASYLAYNGFNLRVSFMARFFVER